MAVPREHHTATLLADGRVLVVGGEDDDPDDLATVELWDPATEAFEATGPMAHARTEHTLTALPDGRALVMGGGCCDSDEAAELWDPATGRFGPTGPVPDRSGATATLLPGARVLLVGGYGNGGYPTEAWLWDPTSGEVTPAGSLLQGRTHHTATRLLDGGVLIVGGEGGEYSLDSAELWRLQVQWQDFRAIQTVRMFEPKATLLLKRSLNISQHWRRLANDGKPQHDP